MLPPLDLGPGVITLRDGRRFNLSKPVPADYDLHVVANALGMMPRFAGHTPTPLSVAAHAVEVALQVLELGGSDLEALIGLHHDDTEAFGLCDLPAPYKALLPQYEQLEGRVWDGCIGPALGLPAWADMPTIVKQADRMQLEVEQRWRYGFTRRPTRDERPIVGFHSNTAYLSLHFQLLKSRHA